MRFYTSRNDWLAHNQYKYIKREWKNGQWVYTYPDDVNPNVPRRSEYTMVRAADKVKDVRYGEQKIQVDERQKAKKGLDRIGRDNTTITTSSSYFGKKKKGDNSTHYINDVKIGNTENYEDFLKREEEQKEGNKRDKKRARKARRKKKVVYVKNKVDQLFNKK